MKYIRTGRTGQTIRTIQTIQTIQTGLTGLTCLTGLTGLIGLTWLIGLGVDDYSAAAVEVGAVFFGVSVKHGEDFFPVILLGGTVKGRQDEHEDFRSHADAEQEVAPGKMKNLEQGAPDDDCRTNGVGKVKETLAAFAGKETPNGGFIFFDFTHSLVLT